MTTPKCLEGVFVQRHFDPEGWESGASYDCLSVDAAATYAAANAAEATDAVVKHLDAMIEGCFAITEAA